MPFVQFRVHPGIGCARMGNSAAAYHLASEFPYFLQEEFPNLRFKPKARTHPVGFFTNDADRTATGVAAAYTVFPSNTAFDNKFKEAEDVIFPQAARFRVFAYVYDKLTSRHPTKVFEVTTALADISWTVTLGNKKSVRAKQAPNPAVPKADPFENKALAGLDTTDTSLLCKRLRTNADIPNLAYLFLERDEADSTKVNGRLHVIGNEGEIVGSTKPDGLWSDDWYDSAADGPVTATVQPKAAFSAATGAASATKLKFLSYNVEDLLDSNASSVEALPAWCVIGCPDYVPDMGHFISLWDVSLSRGMWNVENTKVSTQANKHKLIHSLSELDTYKKTDYRIHIHPLLCLFDDVRFVSGETVGQPERSNVVYDRGHEMHPGTAAPPPTADPDTTRSNAVENGGALIDARNKKADLASPAKLKDPDPTKPILAWIKPAVFMRLRKPKTLYDRLRNVRVRLPGKQTDDYKPFMLPRPLGRRMDYDKSAGPGSLKGLFYGFFNYARPRGNLREWHGIPGAGNLCGVGPPPTVGPPANPVLSVHDKLLLQLLDDNYWPATFSDMPMLRELAFTPLQYQQFEAWKNAGADPQAKNIFDRIVSPALATLFGGAGDADKHFTELLAKSPFFAPALIDMAHLGAMIGGSFLPGIEVGREAAIATNWSLFHGPTPFFPSVRFKPADDDAEHTSGTLTKDLAIPWSEDFADCDETFWPTSRPGRTTKDGVNRIKWQIDDTNLIPHLGTPAVDRIEFVKEYWKSLGFIRRDVMPDGSIVFKETEQTWH